MQRLQRAMPELKAIQAKYKEDKQRQQQEVMKFYRENKVNPFGSCLPLVRSSRCSSRSSTCCARACGTTSAPPLQTSSSTTHGHHSTRRRCGTHGHGAGFLFINDLTVKATGVTLVVLIALYVGTQLASTLMMASPTMDTTSA